MTEKNHDLEIVGIEVMLFLYFKIYILKSK